MALDGKTVTTYMGVPIQELSREKLIEALEEAAAELQRELEYHMSTLGMLEFLTRKAA